MDKIYSNKIFGEALKEIIDDKQIKLRSLAAKTNLNYSYFSKLKKIKKAPPLETIINISRALDIDPNYFMEYRIRKISSILIENPDLIDPTIDYIENIIDDKITKVAENDKDDDFKVK